MVNSRRPIGRPPFSHAPIAAAYCVPWIIDFMGFITLAEPGYHAKTPFRASAGMVSGEEIIAPALTYANSVRPT
jgi:hypothetical protein